MNVMSQGVTALQTAIEQRAGGSGLRKCMLDAVSRKLHEECVNASVHVTR